MHDGVMLLPTRELQVTYISGRCFTHIYNVAHGSAEVRLVAFS